MPDTNLLGPPKQTDPKPRPLSAPPKEADSQAPLIGALVRVYWMLLGNGILALLALVIVEQGRYRAWVTDAVFWTAVASLVLVRYIDISLLAGATASGEPASLRDWRRYTRSLLLLALAVWIGAHAVARISF